ncbi:MAG: DUF6522 family protein [Pseudomonadota bacterium]
MKMEFDGPDITIAAQTIAEQFDLEAHQVPELMRLGAMTGRFETGVGEDAGRYRVTFWYAEKRLQFTIDEAGDVLEISTALEPQRGLAV